VLLAVRFDLATDGPNCSRKLPWLREKEGRPQEKEQPQQHRKNQGLESYAAKAVDKLVSPPAAPRAHPRWPGKYCLRPLWL
jgi:hypothetical protein